MAKHVNNLRVIGVVALCAISSSCEGTHMNHKKDDLLVKKVREAVNKKISVEKIEDIVGTRAVINTTRQEDKNLSKRVSISIDPKESEVATLHKARHFVYWMRPIKSNDAKIVGVVWTENDEMKFFFGIVLPP